MAVPDQTIYSQKFTVKNAGKTIKTYTLSHSPAGTALTIDAVSFLSCSEVSKI
jgi:hypothetical protein